jgi:hypothetical protein
MKWCTVALCAGILLGTDACSPIAAPTAASGLLVFRKDTANCADTVNTELFVDGASLGQFVLGPGSERGFEQSAVTHIAHANELAGKLRQFLPQGVSVPPRGSVIYLMTCRPPTPPPDPSPGW